MREIRGQAIPVRFALQLQQIFQIIGKTSLKIFNLQAIMPWIE